jgi:phosphoesterase RecJ-like protein
VNEFASKYYGGGGHKNAAGGEVKGDMMEAITRFLSFIKEDNPKKRTLAEKQ